VTTLLGLLVAWVAPIAIILLVGVEVHYGGFHFGTGAATVSSIEELLVVVVLGAALSLVSLILYLVSFNVFRKVTSGFGGPVALLVVGLVGLLLIVVGLALVLSDFFRVVACTTSGATTSCLDLNQLVGAVLAIFGGLFLAFLGWIGLVIGVYRIGKRYGSTITKVGAILLIIPFLGLVAPILILVGTHQIVRQLERRTPRL
jgi:Protein of unknown function (DUF973)